ncbi:MAG TPA: FAD-dependent oxidoreductase [Rhodocyclaceae bacterium]|nr:FAD-dependent oxidoreductase [Rhodocyclaceae bacterium]
MRHLIIGNGPAGIVAAETLRRLDPAADIAVIGEEAEPPYSRMAIPYLLSGAIAEQGTRLRKEPGHFERLNIRLVQGRAEKVDSTARTVTLADGGVLAYDRLLIASGSHALRPPGMDLPGVHACWTLADARAIAERAKPGTRVLQIGAGFIGCIILEALVARGVKLTVVEMGDRMVPRMMTEGAGNMIRRWVEGRGVAVHVNCRVESLAARDGALAAKLDSGETVHADLVICAAGVAPNVAFLKGSGVDVGRGVRVDASMQTKVPGIYAAGDVAEAADFHSGEPTVNAIQPNAAEQARIAAGNMAGENTRTQGSLAINVLDTLGLVSTSFGQWWAGDGVEAVDEEKFRYLSLQFHDDVLIGATAVGLTDHVGALRGLIQGRVKLGAWKQRLQADPSQFMAAYLGCAQKAA